ncbi:MAG: hypothetical protein ACLPVY_01765 [Acidimicrobiia bacterium]
MPELVHGAWARKSVSVGGGPHFETQRVVWLQSGTRYADIRLPFHPAADQRCFAGSSGWDGDRYRWTHRLDLAEVDSPPADDIADLISENGVLVERGIFPSASGAVAYEEVWVRLAGAEGTWQAVDARDGCLVRVGDHAITVVDRRRDGGRFAASYRVRSSTGWKVELALGDATGLPLPGGTEPGWLVVHAGDVGAVTA